MTAVSVVVPSWNDAAMLERCLPALARQTRRPDEVIVVDNASTDDTAEVARRHGARVVEEPVRGILRATAAGFDAATGDVVARIDADSVPDPEWLDTMLGTLESVDGPAAVAGPCRFYGSARPVHWFGRHVYLGGYFTGMELVLGQPPLFGSNMVMHTAIWHRMRHCVNRDTGAVHDDLYLSMRLPSDVTVVRDNSERVAISARPFASPVAIAKRALWGVNTLLEGATSGALQQSRAARRQAAA